MSQRGGDRTERASALVLLAVVALASWRARADVAEAASALDARERYVQRLECVVQRAVRDDRPLTMSELNAVLAARGDALAARADTAAEGLR